MDINQRIEALRQEMRQEHLAAFIFPSTDPHNSEYVPERWTGRQWISGFNGSAGTAVVTMKSAALWTDSRYFLAAEEQLSGTPYKLMRLKMPGTPTITEWLGRQLADGEGGSEVGIDGMCASYNTVERLTRELRRQGGLTLRTNLDILQRIWKDRPPLPLGSVVTHPLRYAGEDATSKLRRLRDELWQRHACGILVSALDDVAWLLNLRGSDVHCNPVFVAYLLVTEHQATLFVNPNKLSAQVLSYLENMEVRVKPYDDVARALRHYEEYNILLDGDETSYSLAKAVQAREIVWQTSPAPEMKAVKNKAEIKGFDDAMLRDGVAMVKFLKWLKPAVEAGTQTELSVTAKLTKLRSEQPLYRGLSFDTIAGYGPHGAIVHYEATPATNARLEPRGLLLLDSGAQYADGTTDITRTIALGPLTQEEKRIYTLVLKGHIQLEMCKFPDGASGTQLDIMARKDMWREGLNYLHGTGHGVGSYLNVHEGPHQIRMEWKPAPLRSGMTVTDEPGIYLPGRFGCRIENTLITEPYMQTEFGKFLQFRPLTLCPIDTGPIISDMLTQEEKAWLNDYHAKVYQKLLPLLSDDEGIWLQRSCRAIE